MHVSDLFSAEFPAGNAAATMSYVEDPVSGKPIPLHILWDMNALRSPELEDVETRPDPDMGQDTDRLVQNMVKFILEGVAPVDEAPQLPEGYWEKLQLTSAQRITLAGYRIADLILAAADNIEAQRKFLGR